jgi:hypothetical protein
MLEGPIRVGDHFVWEPWIAHAREEITVTQVVRNTDQEVWIESANARGERHWNDEGRFREACERRKG